LSRARPLTIWPGHAPVLAETRAGGVRYADDVGEHALSLSPGMLQVHGNEVLILVGGALRTSEEDGGESLNRLTGVLLASRGDLKSR
jgi:F0F1-type ATP synthase epsilon subunit